MSSYREPEDLSGVMAEDVRACLELLEEQIASLKTGCPCELLDAYEDIVEHLDLWDDVTGGL